MANHSEPPTDDTTQEHPAADLETIIVDPDDVIEMMRRNHRDETEQRTHVLRVTPPLDGEKRATLYVSEDYSYYPPEMDPEPLHISAGMLLGDGTSHRIPEACRYPNRHDEMALFREEYGYYDEDGEPRELTDEEEEEWDEWWNIAVETIEGHIRHTMNTGDEITLGTSHPEMGTTTVTVRYESNAE